MFYGIGVNCVWENKKFYEKKSVSFSNCFENSEISRIPKVPGINRVLGIKVSKGGSSGTGSYNQLAKFKAEFLNKFVAEYDIKSVTEFGSDDSNQHALFNFPVFIGLDASKKAIAICMDRYKQDRTKSFFLYDSLSFIDNVGFFWAD